MIYLAVTLLFIALGALIVGFFLQEDVRKVGRLVSVGSLLIGSVLLVLSSAVAVQPGHVGVPVLFGQVQEYTLDEGMHFVNPFVRIDEMSIQTQTITMTGKQALHTMSNDQLLMKVDVSVLYHLNSGQAPGIRRLMPEYSSTVVIPSVRTAVREAVLKFDGVAAASGSMDELAQEMIVLVRKRISNALDRRDLKGYSIQIDDVQLRNIALPPEIRESIVSVQRQHQQGNEKEQSIRTARQEAERAITEATGASRVAIIEATRDAQTRLIRAEGEAAANNILARSITPEILRLRAIDATRAITSSDRTHTVILGGGSEQTPLILNMGQ